MRCSEAQINRFRLSTVICLDFSEENFADDRPLFVCDFAVGDFAPLFAFFAAIDFLEAALRDPDTDACFLLKRPECLTSAIV
jgi:hypothetical protein